MQPNNVVVLEGNVTRQPTSRKAKRKDGTEFFVGEVGLAVNKRITKNGVKDTEVSFFDLVFAGGMVDKVLMPYVSIGSHISIVGELKQQSWKDKEGNPRSRVVVMVENMKLLDKKPQDERQPQPTVQYDQPREDIPPIEINDDEIPF